MSSTDVLETIRNARVNGDFDLVKRLSKRELENPQSDRKHRLDIMNEIVHMYLDCHLIWINEIKRIDGVVNPDALRVIAQKLEDNPNKPVNYTQYMKEMIATDAEEVRNIFLSVDDDDMEKAKEARKDARGIL